MADAKTFNVNGANYSIIDQTARDNASKAMQDAEYSRLESIGAYPGRDLATVFAEEIKQKANVWEWLRARVRSANYSGIREYSRLESIGAYPGRDLATVFAEEIKQKANVWEWLRARVRSANYSGIRIGDYIDVVIPQTAQVASQTVRYAVGAIDPYYQCGDTAKGHHIAMVPKSTVAVRGPNAVNDSYIQWRKTADNNGTNEQKCPYLLSQLHEWENEHFLSALPAEVQAAIMSHRVLLEERYSSSGKLTEPSGWSWQDLGKIWSLSEVEVYGLNAWSKPGYGTGFDCQFPIFKQTKDRIMGGRIGWWLRSVSGSSSSYVCYVNHIRDCRLHFPGGWLGAAPPLLPRRLGRRPDLCATLDDAPPCAGRLPRMRTVAPERVEQARLRDRLRLPVPDLQADQGPHHGRSHRLVAAVGVRLVLVLRVLRQPHTGLPTTFPRRLAGCGPAPASS